MTKNKTIFFKIFGGSVFLIILILFFNCIFTFFYEYKQCEEEILEEALGLSENIYEMLDTHIVEINTTIASIYYEIYKNPDGAISELLCTTDPLSEIDKFKLESELSVYFAQLFLMNFDMVSMYLYANPDMNYTYSSYAGVTLDYSPLDTSWYTTTLAQNGQTVVTLDTAPEHILYKKPVISFSRKLANLSNDGISPNAVIRFDFTLDNFNDFINMYILNELTTVVLFDTNGEIITQDGAELILPEDFYETVTDNDSPTFTTKIGNSNYMIASNLAPVYDWTVVIATNTRSIMDYMLDYLIYTLTMLTLLIFIGASIAYYFSKTITRPIQQLKEGMQVIQTGNFDISLPKESDDELGALIDNFNLMASHSKKMIQERYEEELQKKDAQYKFLQAQIDPHFIFNTLQIISSMAIVHKTPEIETMSNSLARLIRYSIHGTNKTIELKEEIKNVKSYLDIQKIRFNNRINYSFNIDDNLQKIHIIKLILQPIIENSITHGRLEESSLGFIHIHVFRSDENIYIEIIDNGVGMTEITLDALITTINLPYDYSSSETFDETKTKGNHVGLRNINQRLKLYYGNAYGLKITCNADCGIKVVVTIPFYNEKDRIK